jgi:DNA gyrase subunit A
MEIGMVHRVDIEHEMQQSYLDYAMSVIVSRALPDARDGLKPVQRRILYAMYDMGLRPDTSYKKSARIVGEVLGKYHPHGDLAVYEAMARMAQDFSMRNALVDGQGNFGSVDGDPPAAMRYTEARLTPMAMEMLNQIDRDTIDFSTNFDETLREPVVLPAAAPNLLVNGGSGIAVGMATSIPPHNLIEVVDALVYMLNRWEGLDDVNVSDLMKFVKGPDFPTGGIILQESDKDDLTSAYATGRGKVVVRGRVHLEEAGRGRSRIIITELPYQTNKASLMERIAELAREEIIEGIADLRDESDRQGMRIVIELNKAAGQDTVLRELYRKTSLQSTFRISLLALVDNEPRMLSLKQALRVYLEHRLTVVRRRAQFDLAKAKARAHILEGLRIALKFLDEVIALIRKAPDVETARQRLMKQFKLDELQAQAILDMPLRRLAALERKKIEDEYKELMQTIHDLEALLASPKKMRQVVQGELEEMKTRFGDKRRTQIVHLSEGELATNLLTTTDLMPGADVWISVNADGLIGRMPFDRLPPVTAREAPRWALSSNTHHTLYLVNQDGRAAAIPVHALPEITAFSEGAPYHRISPFGEGNGLAAVFSVPQSLPALAEGEDRYVVTVTRKGMVKKTSVSELPGPSSQLFTLARVNEGDRLGWVMLTTGEQNLFLATATGMAIRFAESEVRPMGLVAAGVNGMKLNNNDEVIGADAVSDGSEVLLVASNGKGWHNLTSDYPLQGRYGQGVIATRIGPGVTLVGMLSGTKAQAGVVHHRSAGFRGLRIADLPVGKRGVVGQELLPVKSADQIQAVASIHNLLGFWNPERLKLAGPEPKSRSSRAKATAPAPDGKPAKPAAARKVAAEQDSLFPVADSKTPGKTVRTPAAKPAAAKESAPAAKPAEKKATSPEKLPVAKPAAKKAATPEKPAVVKPAAAKAPAKPAAKTPAKPSPAKPAAKPAPAATPLKPARKPATPTPAVPETKPPARKTKKTGS